jgi:hypothetical protein
MARDGDDCGMGSFGRRCRHIGGVVRGGPGRGVPLSIVGGLHGQIAKN